MNRAVLWLIAAVASSAVLGCQSDLEKMADEACACPDEQCLQDMQKKWKDKVPDTKLSEADKLPEKDKAALERMMKCSLEKAK